MSKGYMEKITFAEICTMMDRGGGEAWEAVRSVLGAGLAFLPALLFPEAGFLANVSGGASLLAARDAIQDAGGCVRRLWKQDAADFVSPYERAQAAQVLMVLTAYFDSIRLYLPDESGQIALSKKEKLALTEASLREYEKRLRERDAEAASPEARELADYSLDFRAPLESAERYQERLQTFYERLNEQFIRFFDGLSAWERMSGQQRERFMAALRRLPEDAAGNYEKQYIALKQESEEFRFWAETREHVALSNQLDVGFRRLSKQLHDFAGRLGNKGVDTLDNYAKKYEAVLDEELIRVSDMGEALPDETVFPKKGEIFIPQRFKALLYERNQALEPKKTWDDLEERDDIGGFILDTLRHSQAGGLPLLILGLPGAGKTLLCHMLAARLLLAEYHVIIVRLRDTVADSTILRQVNDQIQRDFENGCKWEDIVRQDLGKQLLLIFDGYDELLQASGRTYADYLNNIMDFQRDQRTVYGVRVKCILTSRTTLIDKASIARGTTVIKLCEFDEGRIKQWSDVWNAKNRSYFAAHRLEPFAIDPESKVYKLAKQPLLLFLLALYDTDGNALRRNANLTGAELYDRLIRYYIERELRKEQPFREQVAKARERAIDRELRRVSIAALGMYNRRALYIRSGMLQRDLDFIMPDRDAREEKGATLTKSEKLLGSFFFIHRSEAREDARNEEEKTAAYEFLHNTFGEFLTAHFIVSELEKELRTILDGGKESDWEWRERKELLLALSYAPLSSRPIVVEMIREWAPSYFRNKRMDEEDAAEALEKLLAKETERIVSGKAISVLDECLSINGNPLEKRELVAHLACFCLNLLILGALVCGEEFKFRVENETWDKLICLWRFGFTEAELLNFADIFYTERDERQSCLRCLPEITTKGPLSALEQIAWIGWAIGDRRNAALADTLLGDDETEKVLTEIDRYGLETSAQYLWNNTMRMLEIGGLEEKLRQLEEACFKQGRIENVLAYYLLLGGLLKNQDGRIREGYYERALHRCLRYCYNTEFVYLSKNSTCSALLLNALLAIAERLPAENVDWDLLSTICINSGSPATICLMPTQMIKVRRAGLREDSYALSGERIVHATMAALERMGRYPSSLAGSAVLEAWFSLLELRMEGRVDAERLRRVSGKILRDLFRYYRLENNKLSTENLARLIRCLNLSERLDCLNLSERLDYIVVSPIVDIPVVDITIVDIPMILPQDCPITEIYGVSPEAAYEMCLFQEKYNYFDHDTFLSGAKQLLADHEDDMPVKLYRKLKDMLETT